MYNKHIKFRSPTSDNINRWKSRGGKSHKKQHVKRDRVKKKENAGARKGRKAAKRFDFQ
jgi:hypothetical protein